MNGIPALFDLSDQRDTSGHPLVPVTMSTIPQALTCEPVPISYPSRYARYIDEDSNALAGTDELSAILARIAHEEPLRPRKLLRVLQNLSWEVQPPQDVWQVLDDVLADFKCPSSRRTQRAYKEFISQLIDAREELFDVLKDIVTRDFEQAEALSKRWSSTIYAWLDNFKEDEFGREFYWSAFDIAGDVPVLAPGEWNTGDCHEIDDDPSRRFWSRLRRIG